MREERPITRHRQFHLALPLWVRFRDRVRGKAEPRDAAWEDLTEEEQTTTTSISSEDCFFYVARKPAVGATATMRVDIPLRAAGRYGKVLCKGRVIRVSDPEANGKVGVECTIDSFRFALPGGR